MNFSIVAVLICQISLNFYVVTMLLQEKRTFQFPHLVIKQIFVRITQVHIFFDEILSV